MVPPYDAFMKPILETLADGRAAPFSELGKDAAARLGLPADATAVQVDWDGMPVVEARVRKAAQDLEKAGLVARDGDRVCLTEVGRAELPQLPSQLTVPELTARFPAYAAYRAEFKARRGA